MKGSVLVFILLLSVLAAQADPRIWNTAGLAIRQGHHTQWQRTTAQYAAGNTIMVWTDARNGVNDIYAQLISPEGAMQWSAGGVNVTHQAPGRQEYPAVCAVDGGWMVAWIDYRDDDYGDVWAQKLDNNGNLLWTGNNSTGMPVDEYVSDWAMVNEGSIRIVHDGSGGALVAWEDTRRGDSGDIYAQHIGADGTVAAESAYAITSQPREQIGLNAVGDGNGNMLLTWQDMRNQNDRNIYAAKFTSDNTLPWGTDGILVCGATGSQVSPQIVSDGFGGCFIAWTDERTYQSTYDDLYIQLDANGNPQFAADGIPVCNSAFHQRNIRIATSVNEDSYDGCIAVWEDARVNNDRKEIYAQKISLAGAAQWAANGIHVCGDAMPSGNGNTREDVMLASDWVGGLVCAWMIRAITITI
jgi:hypothetical protein